MWQPSLEELLLTPEELEFARQQIQEMAYVKWEKAGSPHDGSNRFWNEAELEWIEYFYVPHRSCDGALDRRS